ncbi:MAG: nuclear transport factor 2 family protein [Thermoplasmata archaeon]
MGVEENKRVIEARVQAHNARDYATWESLHTDSVTRTAPELGKPLQGKAALLRALKDGIADYDHDLEIERLVGEANHVYADLTAKGRQKQFRFPASMAFRFEGDKIAQVDEHYDLWEIFRKAGMPKMSIPKGMGWRMLTSLVIGVSWLVFAIIFTIFWADSLGFSVFQAVVILLLTLLGAGGLVALLWASMGWGGRGR